MDPKTSHNRNSIWKLSLQLVSPEGLVNEAFYHANLLIPNETNQVHSN